jgi:hypothetical protein
MNLKQIILQNSLTELHRYGDNQLRKYKKFEFIYEIAKIFKKNKKTFFSLQSIYRNFNF